MMREEVFSILTLGNIMFTGGKNIVAFDIVIPSKPGVLASISNVFSKYNINILSVTLPSTISEKERVHGFIVGDFSNSLLSPEDIKSKIEELEVVFEVRIVKPIEGSIIYSRNLFPIYQGDVRSIMIDQNTIKVLLSLFKEHFGEGFTESLLYYTGYNTGKAFHKVYIGDKNIKLEEALELLNAFLIGFGWARIVNVRLYEDNIVVQTDRLWECEVLEGKVQGSASRYFKGFLEGFLFSFLKKNIRITETSCIALGNSFCTFQISIKQC
ncbi:MAG: hypothetical protein QXY40_08945 [Candidatus Methanomethylicia archaeon]